MHAEQAEVVTAQRCARCRWVPFAETACVTGCPVPAPMPKKTLTTTMPYHGQFQSTRPHGVRQG